jgi:hypothetical protein
VWLAITVTLGLTSFLLLRRSANVFNQAAGYASIFGLLIALYTAFRDKSNTKIFDQTDYDRAVQTLSERVTRTEALQRQRLLDRAAEPAPMLLRAADFLQSYRGHAQPQQTESIDIFSVFWSLKSKRMLLLGDPGAGKTLLLLELIRQAAVVRKSDQNVPILIRVNIAEWRDDHAFRDYFAEKVAAQQFLPTKLIARMLDDGKIIPLLDGLDEFDLENSPPIRGCDAIGRLNTIADGSYPVNAPLIVTCRKTYFQALENLQIENNEMVGLGGAGYFLLDPLGPSQILIYLRTNLADEARPRWESILNALRSQYPSPLKTRLVAALGSPWRLMLAFRAYADRGIPGDLLDDRDVALVEARLLPQFLAVAMQWRGRHAKDRGRGYGLQQTWIRPVASDPSKVVAWLKQIALYLERGRDQGGGAGELVPYQIYQMVDGKFFYGAFIGGIASAATAIGVLIAVVAINGHHPLARIAAICAAGIFLIGGALVAILGSPDTPAGMSVIRQIRTPKGLLDMGIALFCAIAASAFTLGTNNTVGARVLGGCCCGFMAALLFGFVLARRSRARGTEMAVAQTPADPLRGGLLDSSIVGLVVALIYGLIIITATNSGARSALIFAGCTLVIFAPIMGMPLVSMAWSRYRLAVLILFLQRRLPWRIVTFLQWNYNAGLMRVSGLSYQFRHLRLQDWLAQTSQDELLADDQ